MKKLSILMLTVALPVLAAGQQFPEFRVNVIEIKGRSYSQTEKMKRAVTIFENVLNDAAFQKELTTKTFKSDRDDDLVPDPTASRVIEKIYAGRELYNPEPNNAADIYWYAEKTGLWKRMTDRCNTIGYGYPGEKEIYTYTCLLKEKDSLAKLAGHIAHEWSHKLGFVHRAEDHAERHLTVPYVFGDLVFKHAARWTGAD
ncbi:MAG: hypothetical protein OEQ28_12845 [Acidobacteriota bacterium]|nr:hypothetical protein [Acidobacteriota bacterium]